MRLIVPDMQEMSRRLTALATESQRALRRLGGVDARGQRFSVWRRTASAAAAMAAGSPR